MHSRRGRRPTFIMTAGTCAPSPGARHYGNLANWARVKYEYFRRLALRRVLPAKAGSHESNGELSGSSRKPHDYAAEAFTARGANSRTATCEPRHYTGPCASVYRNGMRSGHRM